MSDILANNIARGIWYRRKDGGMYGARLIADGRVEFTALHPNTLESIGKPGVFPVEHFYCFFCRASELTEPERLVTTGEDNVGAGGRT